MDNTNADVLQEFDSLLSRTRFYRQGAIIPQKVLRGPKRKKQHQLTFGSDSWVLPTKTGYLVVCATGVNTSAIRLRGLPAGTYIGSPYHPGGETHWQGDKGISRDQWAKNVIETLKKKNGEAFL